MQEQQLSGPSQRQSQGQDRSGLRITAKTDQGNARQDGKNNNIKEWQKANSTRQGMTGQDSAGQDRAAQNRAGQDKAGWMGWDGLGWAGLGWAGLGRAGQDRARHGTARQGRADKGCTGKARCSETGKTTTTRGG